MSKEKINQFDSDILQAEKDWQAELARLDLERDQVTREWEFKTNELQAERDALALSMKLKEYPVKLIKSHKTCAICGAEMRPFRVARGETVIKLWACAAGNLSETHDLVTVE